MNNIHLAIITALAISAVLFVSSYNTNDMSGFQQKISRRDYQAYDDTPLLPESVFKEVMQ
jgi:hypothetical protein